MKRCPECRRDYYDDTLLYCLDDGNALLEGPATADEPATAILSEPGAIATGFRDGDVTRPHVQTTDQTAIFPSTAEAEPRESLGELSEKPRFWHKKRASVAEAGNRSARRMANPLVVAVVAVILLVGGSYLTAAGRADEALAETGRALELEPLALINNSVHVTSYINARQYDKALVQARRTYELDRDFPLARTWLGLAYAANGKYDEAVALSKEVSPQSPSWVAALCVMAYAHAKAGRRVEAEAAIAQMKEIAKTRYVRSYYIAWVYAALGDKDKAFAELEQSFVDKDCFLPRARVDPFMDPLRDDRRFKELLTRMNLPE